MRKPTLDKHVYEFNIELEFPGEVEPVAEKLTGTIIDAIYDYDNRNRLLPGTSLPPGGERLIGSSIKFEKYSREPDTIRAITGEADLPDFWDEGEPERNSVVEISDQISKRIEELFDIQAALWDAYDPLAAPETREDLRSARPKARRAIKRQSTKLAKLMPGLKVA